MNLPLIFNAGYSSGLLFGLLERILRIKFDIFHITYIRFEIIEILIETTFLLSCIHLCGGYTAVFILVCTYFPGGTAGGRLQRRGLGDFSVEVAFFSIVSFTILICRFNDVSKVMDKIANNKATAKNKQMVWDSRWFYLFVSEQLHLFLIRLSKSAPSIFRFQFRPILSILSPVCISISSPLIWFNICRITTICCIHREFSANLARCR